MNQDFQKGLTLIELMAVVTMIVIVTGIVFANYGIGRDSLALERAGQKLYQDFRLAINVAMAGSTDFKGMGIYFNTSTDADRRKYIMYKNMNLDPTIWNRTGNYTDTVINIEPGVEIGSISSGSPLTAATIYFKSPYPTTYLNSTPTRIPSSISIQLRMISDHNRTRTVTVNSSGMIDITD